MNGYDSSTSLSRRLGLGVAQLVPEAGHLLAEALDVVVKNLQTLALRPQLSQIADHLFAAPAEAAVEFPFDHALERWSRLRIAVRGEALDGGVLDAEVGVGQELLDPLAGLAGGKIPAAAAEIGERQNGGPPTL